MQSQLGPQRDPIETITKTGNPVRRLLHGLIAVCGWLGFAWFLQTVFLEPLDSGAIPTFLLLAMYTVGIVAVNWLWVWFNIHLQRKATPRRRPMKIEFTSATDQVGRRLVGNDWPRLRRSSRIRIDIDPKGGVKTYHDLDGGGRDQDVPEGPEERQASGS